MIVQASTESPVREVAEKRSIPIFELSFDTNDPAGIFSLTGARKTASSSFRSPAFAGDDDIALVLRTSGTIGSAEDRAIEAVGDDRRRQLDHRLRSIWRRRTDTCA